MSGTLDDATRRVVLEVEKRKIAAALQESGDDALRAAEILGMAPRLLVKKIRSLGAHALVPSDLSARVSAAPVTSVTTRVRPMPVGSTKCSVPASTFLSRAVAATHAAADRSAIGGRGPTPIDQRRDAIGLGRAHRAPGAGHGHRRQHPPAHRLAVLEAAVVRDRLEGVAERVAEIEDAAQPGLVLVDRDHVRLDARAGDDDRQQRLGVAGADAIEIALEPREQPRGRR